MKFWVGITDRKWFNYLSQLKPDEVNFWQPAGSRNFKALQSGDLFLFKLHSPHNFVVGGGYFVEHSILPLTLPGNSLARRMAAQLLSRYMRQFASIEKNAMT